MYKTRQEVFDAVVAGFAAQDFQIAYESIGGCMYRAPNGAKCAVGVLIPDTLYDPDMEFTRVDAMMERFPELSALFGPEVDMAFLKELQSAHDSVGDAVESGGHFDLDLDDDYDSPMEDFEVPAALKSNLRDFAAEYNLIMPEVLTPRIGA